MYIYIYIYIYIAAASAVFEGELYRRGAVFITKGVY